MRYLRLFSSLSFCAFVVSASLPAHSSPSSPNDSLSPGLSSLPDASVSPFADIQIVQSRHSERSSIYGSVESALDWIGSGILMLLGVEDLEQEGLGTGIGWSESSVYVERTNSLHPSRPSSFGPHLTSPLSSFLYPISVYTGSTRGCEDDAANSTTSNPSPPAHWIALIERGHCPFSQKVRTALQLGAEGVIFGDMSVEEGGLGGAGGLLTPWSPDDTSDITIPSSFVSRAAYLSLVKTWEEEQTIPDLEELEENEVRGLAVVMSKDEVFTWPLLDLLLLLLFLPSLLTILTILTQRIRQIRQQKMDRAPKELVERLPVFIWNGEKEGDNQYQDPQEGTSKVGLDEEAQVGVAEGDMNREDEDYNDEEPNESTHLLRHSSAPKAHGLGHNWVSNWKERIYEFMGHEDSFDASGPSSLGFLGMGGSTSKSRGKKRESIAPIKKRIAGLTECAICLCDFEKGELVMILPCGHLFHKEEIEDWLVGSKRICPICRASITVEKGDSDSTSDSDSTNEHDFVPNTNAGVSTNRVPRNSIDDDEGDRQAESSNSPSVSVAIRPVTQP